MKATLLNNELSEKDLVERILNGEKHLYELIMRKYNARLYRMAMSVINDDAEAEDIMQNAYINAFNNLSSFNNQSALGTWLTRIVINESLLRKKKIAKKQEQLKGMEKTKLNYDTPLNNLLNNELKNLLETTVSKLPEKYRTVFIMREIEEMSISETMDALQMSESNVKVRLNRAKEMLRNDLSAYYKSKNLYDFNLVRCDRVVENVMMNI